MLKKRGLSDIVRRVLAVADELGFSASTTSKGHLKFSMPGTSAVFFSGTPSDPRSLQAGITKLKRAARAAQEQQ